MHVTYKASYTCANISMGLQVIYCSFKLYRLVSLVTTVSSMTNSSLSFKNECTEVQNPRCKNLH